MYWGNDAASEELKISSSVDLISRLKTWLRYELFDINPVQERRVLGRLSLDSHREGIAYHSLNKITCTKDEKIRSIVKSIKCNKQSVDGLSEQQSVLLKDHTTQHICSTLRESRGSLLLAEYCRVFAKLSISSMNTKTKVPLS